MYVNVCEHGAMWFHPAPYPVDPPQQKNKDEQGPITWTFKYSGLFYLSLGESLRNPYVQDSVVWGEKGGLFRFSILQYKKHLGIPSESKI